MNAQTCARAAGIEPGTFNAWIRRGLIPGMTIGVSGRRQNIDLDTATRVAIFAELFRLGIPAGYASMFVTIPIDRHAKRLIVMKYETNDEAFLSGKPLASTLESDDQIPEYLRSRFPDGPPTYVVINVERLAERMRRAEKGES